MHKLRNFTIVNIKNTKRRSQKTAINSCIKLFSFVLAICFVASCSSNPFTHSTLPDAAGWAIMPFANSTSSAIATRSTSTMVESHLRARGVKRLIDFSGDSAVSSDNIAVAKNKAVEAGYRYGVTGSIEKWRDTGVIGRAHHVGVSLKVIDLATDKVLWHDSEMRRGASLSGVAALTGKAVGKLVGSIALKQELDPIQASNELSHSAEPLLLAAALSDEDIAKKFPGEKLDGKSVAIYYGAKPPVRILSQFDRLILEPDNISASKLKKLTSRGASALAYLSVFEVGPHRAYAKDVRSEWVLGENKIWDSMVMDLANPEWREFLLKRVDELMAAGYKGLFLDTMDSYHIYAASARDRQVQEDATVEFLRQASLRHPGIHMIANRGFDILENGAQYLEGMAAESLYASWDNLRQEYVKVNAQDREWLLGKLNEARQRHSLEIISIEYLPAAQRIEAKKVARKVAEHGFIPWVSTPDFDSVGVGLMEVIPRKVIMLYDSRIHGSMKEAVIHFNVTAPLEYYGLVPEYIDLAKQPLPPQQLAGEVAGVISWSDQSYQHPQLADWVAKQLESAVPVVFLGVPGFRISSDMADKMGIGFNGEFELSSLKPHKKDSMIGFDRDVTPRPDFVGLNVRSTGPDNQVHLSYKDAKDVTLDVVITGPWGGIAMEPAVFWNDLDDTPYWIINPFEFFYQALNLQTTPMPDVTTENGRRLWLAHIDGDALPSWAEMPGRKLGAEIIKERILDKFTLPHTISVVEGEMTSIEKYADRRERMFAVARDIFAQPNVEIATHTFSHPYNWRMVGLHSGSGKYNLPIKNYQYDPHREFSGSAEFINTQLAPPGKKTKVALWSGDAMPLESALAAVDEAGLINLNGANTTITKAKNSHALVSPMARAVGPYTQVYAPIMNENVYTDDWRGPFDGFRRVIETMSMTDHPRRLKPINIYYHFYAGTKIATVRALDEIYSWTIAEEINPVFVSEYSVKVPDSRAAGVAKYMDGTWKLSALGTVRSIRTIGSDKWPQLSESQNIVGARSLHDGMYIHTDGSHTITMKLGPKPIEQDHIISSNGKIEKWEVNGSAVNFRIKGHVPVMVELGGESGRCGIISNGRVVRGKHSGRNTTIFNFPTTDTGHAILNCQA